MIWEGKYAVDNPNSEYDGLKLYLESMGQFEEEMSVNEMRDLAKTLKDSLKEQNIQSQTHVPDEEPQTEDFNENNDELFDKEKHKLNEMLSKYLEEDNWDNINVNNGEALCLHVNNNIFILEPSKFLNIKLRVKADVHHELDWEPPKEKEDEETIEIHSRKRRFESIHSFELDAIQSVHEEQENAKRTHF